MVKRKTNYINILLVILLILATLLFLSPKESDAVYAETATTSALTKAEGAVLMEQTSKRVLYSLSPDKKLEMASTTKIVTAYTVIKLCNLDDVVEIPKSAVGIEGSSIYLRAGEHLTVRELLYGLMLRSGNDAAVALALHASGSIEAFAAEMNKAAAEVGALNSNFTNPHGLHDDNHYTTAYDLGLITCHAFESEDFAAIVATQRTMISNEFENYRRVLVNKNKLLKNYSAADGVKTGYTKKAGRCFVGSANKDGMRLVVVVLNCNPMFEDSHSILEFGYSCYTMTHIVPQNKVCGAIITRKRTRYFLCEEGFSYPLSDAERDCITKEIVLPEGKNDTGCINVYLDDDLLFTRILTEKKI
jgi:D-alanyl-D-alanine carboxypeptidase (penicillin-binding protein 5/6)